MNSVHVLRAARLQLGQRLLHEVHRGSRRIGLEIGPRPVALDGIAPLWNFPLELHFRLQGGLRQIDHDAVAGRLDVAHVHQTRQRGGPEPRDRAAAGVERQVIASSLVEPARAHHPGILAVEVALLRPRNGGLIPRVFLINLVAEWIGLDECLAVLPAVVIGVAEKDSDIQIDIDEIGRQ